MHIYFIASKSITDNCAIYLLQKKSAYTYDSVDLEVYLSYSIGMTAYCPYTNILFCIIDLFMISHWMKSLFSKLFILKADLPPYLCVYIYIYFIHLQICSNECFDINFVLCKRKRFVVYLLFNEHKRKDFGDNLWCFYYWVICFRPLMFSTDDY